MDNNTIRYLSNLGLTPLQAKIYLVLLKTSEGKVLSISKMASVDRSNTYRAILQLQTTGLVKKILDTPSTYQAISLKEAATLLINCRKVEYSKMQKMAKRLSRDSNGEECKKEKEHQFVISKMTRERELKEISSCCKTVKNSKDFLLNRKTLYDVMNYLAQDQSSCIKRGVEVRLITEAPNKDLTKKLAPLTTEPNFKVRFVRQTPQTELAILDKKKCSVTLSPNTGIVGRPILYSSHPGCIEMFQNHFDHVWNQAISHNLTKD